MEDPTATKAAKREMCRVLQDVMRARTGDAAARRAAANEVMLVVRRHLRVAFPPEGQSAAAGNSADTMMATCRMSPNPLQSETFPMRRGNDPDATTYAVSLQGVWDQVSSSVSSDVRKAIEALYQDAADAEDKADETAQGAPLTAEDREFSRDVRWTMAYSYIEDWSVLESFMADPESVAQWQALAQENKLHAENRRLQRELQEYVYQLRMEPVDIEQMTDSIALSDEQPAWPASSGAAAPTVLLPRVSIEQSDADMLKESLSRFARFITGAHNEKFDATGIRVQRDNWRNIIFKGLRVFDGLGLHQALQSRIVDHLNKRYKAAPLCTGATAYAKDADPADKGWAPVTKAKLPKPLVEALQSGAFQMCVMNITREKRAVTNLSGGHTTLLVARDGVLYYIDPWQEENVNRAKDALAKAVPPGVAVVSVILPLQNLVDVLNEDHRKCVATLLAQVDNVPPEVSWLGRQHRSDFVGYCGAYALFMAEWLAFCTTRAKSSFDMKEAILYLLTWRNPCKVHWMMRIWTQGMLARIGHADMLQEATLA
jgi:hypothetical protein